MNQCWMKILLKFPFLQNLEQLNLKIFSISICLKSASKTISIISYVCLIPQSRNNIAKNHFCLFLYERARKAETATASKVHACKKLSTVDYATEFISSLKKGSYAIAFLDQTNYNWAQTALHFYRTIMLRGIFLFIIDRVPFVLVFSELTINNIHQLSPVMSSIAHEISTKAGESVGNKWKMVEMIMAVAKYQSNFLFLSFPRKTDDIALQHSK